MVFQKKLLALLVAGAVAGLAGCGGGDSSSDSGGTTPPPSGANDPYEVSAWFNNGDNNRVIDPQLASDGQPSASSPDLQDATYLFTASSPDLQDAAYSIIGSNLGNGFVDVDYIGAFPQDTNNNWTEGWTVGLNGNTTVWAPAATPSVDGNCPTGTTLNGSINLPVAVGGGAMDLCTLAATYTTDGSTLALTADNVYELASGTGTYIGNGNGVLNGVTASSSVTLDIQAGTLILGGSQEALVITRGSEINAIGSAQDPIVMTSRAQFDAWVAGGDGTADRGEWAGFALMGYAQSNECGTPCDVVAEGGIGYYGGTNDADTSGTIQYLVVRQAGNDLDGNGNELNGFTLFGVGSATTMNHIQVHKGLDDGIEHFGSETFMSHIVLTDNGDDSFDWGQGYRGGAQFMVIKQAADQADRAIEADNDGSNPIVTPVSMPTLANMTLIGMPNGAPGADGILLRRGTGAKIYNSVVTGFADSCIDLDGSDTENQLNAGNIVFENVVIDCPKESFESGDADVAASVIQAAFDAGSNNREVNPNLMAYGQPNAIDGMGSTFVTTDYIGAFPQDTADNWTNGWTVGLNGNNTVWDTTAPVADATCPTGTTVNGTKTLPTSVNGGAGGSMDLCTLAASYATDGSLIHLTADNIYQLASGTGTYIGNGNIVLNGAAAAASVTLKIDAGTLILGGSQEALVVTRGSTVEARGTATDPIVMTSVSQFDAWVAGGDGTADRGEWAGFALMGYAQSNECGTPCDVVAEGGIGYYGGTNDADNSGIIEYLVVRQAGNDLDGNGNELNGFTLFSVGSATTMNHIQVHKGLDDGIEHFGSETFMSHIVLTDNGDDSFDWGQGYRGGAQFIVIKQAADQADRGIEADNDGDNPQATPISMPTLANMTIIGQPLGDTGADGIMLRRGTGAKIYNTIVTGFADTCIDIDDDATFNRGGTSATDQTGDLMMANSIVSCPNENFDEE